MHGHHAVVDLAGVPAVLPADTRRLGSLFWVPRFVDDADGLLVGLIPRNQPLRVKTQTVLIPLVAGQELLQGPRCDPGGQRHRLRAPPRQLPGVSPPHLSPPSPTVP